MNPNILVAYATKYGSTGEVAEAIGERLREQGLVVDVKPVKEAPSLDGYDAVVFGAPFYVGSMLKEARAYLERQREALEGTPVAVFALGPTTGEEPLYQAAEQLDNALKKLPWLQPVSAAMFVGKYDPHNLRFRDRLLTMPPASPLHGLGPHDDRDWEAIGAWAEGLTVALGLRDAAA